MLLIILIKSDIISTSTKIEPKFNWKKITSIKVLESLDIILTVNKYKDDKK